MNAYILMKNADGTENRENDILYFSFRKEAYLPYTLLSIRFISSSASFLNVTETRFMLTISLFIMGLLTRSKQLIQAAAKFLLSFQEASHRCFVRIRSNPD